MLNYWGIMNTVDFGHIVFDLVAAGILRKQPEDKIDDFKQAYDFKDVFDKGFKFEEEDSN